VVGIPLKDAEEQVAAIEDQLLLLAATLAGLWSPTDAVPSFDFTSPVVMLVDSRGDDGSACSVHAGELLLAPAFMSAAAEAQVESALEAIRQAKRSTL
jgi:hypothetical protein